MWRFSSRTVPMSISTGPVLAPYSAPWRTSDATFALWISFLLGMQLTLGQEPPIQASLHDGSPPPRLRHVPRQELAACATAKNQDFKSLRLRHAYLRVMLLCLAILGGHSIEVLSTSAPTATD